MAETKRKGDLGEVMILADVLKRGYKAAIPVGEDWKYDLIVVRHGKLERVQCKYAKSGGCVIKVRCRCVNDRICTRYTENEIDWMAVYDATTDKCYYIPAKLLGETGRTQFALRIVPAKQGQKKKIHWAKDFLAF